MSGSPSILSVEDLIAQQACAKLVADYAIAADFGDYDAACNCYAPDGQLTIAGKTHHGRDAIRARLADQPPHQVSRHLIGTVTIARRSPTEAEGRCYLALFRGTREPGATAPLANEPPFLVGHYDDRFVLTADGWRFADRRLTTTFRKP